MRPLVVIPTYDEAENIGVVIDGVFDAASASPLGARLELLVVDDGSPDGTGDIVAERMEDEARLHLLRRPGKAGLGSAYREGFAWGSEHGFDVVVEMDADLSHDPAALPELLAEVDRGADAVIGSRYVPGGSIPNWAWHRRALSRWGNRYAAVMLRLGVNDATAGYRCYRTSLLDRMALDEVRADGYGFQIEMTMRARDAGGVIREVPISFRDRTRGTSKMSGAIVVEALLLVTLWGISRRLGSIRRVGNR